MRGEREHLFVVGAGFSMYAGLPLTTAFTQELLNTKYLRKDGPSSLIIEFLSQFVQAVFEQEADANPNMWPELEDIFTSIDLAANSGHHLGPRYAPADLRTVRRALLTRIIRMLYQTRGRSEKRRDVNWLALEKFFSRVSIEKCAFLSMNWDTVIEEGLEGAHGVIGFDYGCDARGINLGPSGAHLVKRTASVAPLVLKPHGSANWLYCDLCRQLFWTATDQTEAVAKQLFAKRDWAVVHKFIKRGKGSKVATASCPVCRAPSLGTRFGTFSFQKALDFPMHMRTWLRAEQLLQRAKTWTFIGYSLPAADYEFKHLLKRAQLSRREGPKITLVTGGTGADATFENYRHFLGRDVRVFKNGLDEGAFKHLARLGALSRQRSVVATA